MNIRRLALLALLGGALTAFGCGDSSSTTGPGTGGSGGGGEGGGGEGGSGVPSCEATACIFCPADALGPNGMLFGDINVPVNLGNVVQGGTVTIDIAATSEVSGLPVPVVATVEAGSTSSYSATSGGAGSLDIPIPVQTVMGTDLIIDAGTGSGDFDVDADATELVIQITSALIDLQVTMPVALSLTLDASESGDCSVLGDGVTIAVSDGT
jgi:hypothetical protein